MGYKTDYETVYETEDEVDDEAEEEAADETDDERDIEPSYHDDSDVQGPDELMPDTPNSDGEDSVEPIVEAQEIGDEQENLYLCGP